MRATVLASVRDDAQLLEVRKCRAVVLPDGRAGAVWRGLAYAFGPDGAIDVSCPGMAPSLCRSPSALPTGIAHVLVEGTEEAWLLVSGDVADRDLAAARLRAGGVMVLRTGAWLGDPVDGISADWFVRVARPDTDEPLAAIVERLIGRAAAPSAPSSDLRLRMLEAELATARAREALLRREPRAAVVPATSTEAAGQARDIEIAALREELESERALRQVAEAAMADANAALVAAAAAADRTPALPRSPSTGSARRITEEVETVLETLVPHVRLLRDGLTVATSEFRARGGLYRTLLELQPPPAQLPPSWKKVQGLDGWWERHVSTGEDDSGRAYARWENADRLWLVLISHKSEQGRDIAWLRRQ